MNVSRRTALARFAGAATSYALIDLLCARDAMAAPLREKVTPWLRQIDGMCRDLRVEAITPLQWQDQIERLLSDIALPELLRYVDLERIASTADFPDLGVTTTRVKMPKLGRPRDIAFFAKVFAMLPGRAVIPHGHTNMASCHLVLAGEFVLRQYDKLAEDATHMIIRPTLDERVGPSASSSISDAANNVHWFRNVGDEPGFTFDVVVTDLGEPYDISNIDPRAGEPLGDERYRVPKLAVADALQKYGKDRTR